MEQTCKKCGETKPIDDFPINYIWCNRCSGFKSKYPIYDTKQLDISNYTGKRSKIFTKYNITVKLSYLDLNNYINDDYPSYVYVLYSENIRLYKIGMTSDFVRRYQALCTSTGSDLLLKYVINLAPGRDEPPWFIEKFLKDYFKDKKIKGEWFKLNKKDLNEIEDLFFSIEGDDIYTESVPFLIKKHSHCGSVISSSYIFKQIG